MFQDHFESSPTCGLFSNEPSGQRWQSCGKITVMPRNDTRDSWRACRVRAKPQFRQQCGPVAQRLEQGTHNPLVRGSNPCGPTKPSRFVLNELVCVCRNLILALRRAHCSKTVV